MQELALLYAVPAMRNEPVKLEQAKPEFPTHTPEPPYYAVVATTVRTAGDQGYGDMAAAMLDLARQQPGFLGVESVRNADGQGITVSYWKDPDSIAAWRKHSEHREAQQRGRNEWYAGYSIRIARVERAYGKEISQT